MPAIPDWDKPGSSMISVEPIVEPAVEANQCVNSDLSYVTDSVNSFELGFSRRWGKPAFSTFSYKVAIHRSLVRSTPLHLSVFVGGNFFFSQILDGLSMASSLLYLAATDGMSLA